MSKSNLGKKSATKIYGSISLKLGRIKADILKHYLSILYYYHIDYNLLAQVFESPR